MHCWVTHPFRPSDCIGTTLQETQRSGGVVAQGHRVFNQSNNNGEFALLMLIMCFHIGVCTSRRPACHPKTTGSKYRNCSDLRGSADYSAYCGGATEHGISTANRFRPLKREQLQNILSIPFIPFIPVKFAVDYCQLQRRCHRRFRRDCPASSPATSHAPLLTSIITTRPFPAFIKSRIRL